MMADLLRICGFVPLFVIVIAVIAAMPSLATVPWS